MNTRKGRTIVNVLLILALALSIATTALAQGKPEGIKPAPNQPTVDSVYNNNVAKDARQPLDGTASKVLPNGEKLVGVIVRLEGKSLAQQDGTGKLDVTSLASRSYLDLLASRQAAFAAELARAVPSAQITHYYRVVLNGVSVILPESQVAVLRTMSGVTAVLPDLLQHPTTDSSNDFIGSPVAWAALGGQESAGEGVILGVLDTGIWPEHPSFSDPDPSGKPYNPPPGGPFDCNFGNTAWNPNDAPFTCNNKLIGAYEFLDTYKAFVGLTPEEFDSARDSEGHGTHTISTSGGNAGVDASFQGVPLGVISGVAPRTHVIMYRVCAEAGCYSSDSAAATEQAIVDGVSVINFSISGGTAPYSDPVSLAFLDAYWAGVLVSASAGNSGPGADTVAHREPWTMSVAASVQSRFFEGTVHLEAPDGATIDGAGASITSAYSGPVVNSADYDGDGRCLAPFPPGTFSGEVVICRRGVNARVDKGYNVLQGGAGGMILYNGVPNQEVETDNHWLPTVHMTNEAAMPLLSFLGAYTQTVTASLNGGNKIFEQGDVMAAFSSRGGPNQVLGISKPDVTAPGVQILAGHTPMPSSITNGPPGELFQAIAGTSMSSPHNAGAAALVKALRPDWGPGQIKSALMTTATQAVTKEDGATPANPFDFGSGRIDLTRAGFIGLTISDTADNLYYMADHLWDANTPSVYVPNMPGLFFTERTVQDESGIDSVWRSFVYSDPDVRVKTQKKMVVPAYGTADFDIAIDAHAVPNGETRFAWIQWVNVFDPTQSIMIPVTFNKREPMVTMNSWCDPTSFNLGETSACQIDITNNDFNDAMVAVREGMPRPVSLVPGSLNGASPLVRGFAFAGPLNGAEPFGVEMMAMWRFGYIPLSAFGVPPQSGVGDETIKNFNVPTFMFGGQAYTRIGMTSNGYAVIGGGTDADVDFVNQFLPDPNRPNNVLAPFWTDLNPGAGGALRVAILTDGVGYWLILDWEGVPNYSDGEINDFQIWVGLNGVEDVWYTFGPNLSDGDFGSLTVGGENSFGNRGTNWYYNGAGTLPTPMSMDLVVYSTPSAPGETHTITYQIQGNMVSPFELCATLMSNLFPGVQTDCVNGEVTAPSLAGIHQPTHGLLFVPVVRNR